MPEFSMNKKELLSKLGYVSTQSGKVVPAKSKVIAMMSKNAPKPVKDQMSEKFDHRKYDNDSLLMGKNYLSLKDIGVKIMTEATSSTVASPIRLNLDGLVMDDTALKGQFKCLGHIVNISIEYPNANDKISIMLSVDGNSKTSLFEEPIDALQSQGNMSESIRRSAIDLIKNLDSADNLDDTLSGTGVVAGMGNNFDGRTDFQTASMMPSSLLQTESVDWQMQKLLNICLESALLEDGEDGEDGAEGGDFGADDFAAPDAGGDMGGDMNADPGSAPAGDAGSVNGNPESANSDDNETMMLREFCLPTSNRAGLSHGAFDTMAKIAGEAMERAFGNSNNGFHPSGQEFTKGFVGVENMSEPEILDTFLSLDEYKALDMEPLPIEGLEQFARALEDKMDVSQIKNRLGEWFENVYNTDGVPLHNIDEETANMQLPGDDMTGVGQGIDLNAPIGAPTGDIGDMMDAADQMAGLGGPSANENGDDSNDNTDFAVDSLDNLF